MLQIQIIGNLTKDAEIKQSQKTGDNFLTFTVAVNEGKDKPAIFIRCLRKAYEGTQNLVQYMQKGKKVYLQGRPTLGIYNDQQQNTVRPELTCFVERIELLSSAAAPTDNTAPQAAPQPTAQPAAAQRPLGYWEATNPNAATFGDNSDQIDNTDLPF